MYSMSRMVKGLTILEGWLPPLRTPVGGISLVSASVTSPLQSWVALWQTDLWKPCSPALIPSACCLSFSKGLGLPTLRFPQRQNGEILPVIISPQKDVVIKMAAKVFCKIKKHNKTPTEEAYYLYQAFARMSETSSSLMKNSIGFQDLFWNYCALVLILTSKQPLARAHCDVDSNNDSNYNHIYWVVSDKLTVLSCPEHLNAF